MTYQSSHVVKQDVVDSVDQRRIVLLRCIEPYPTRNLLRRFKMRKDVQTDGGSLMTSVW